MDSGAWRPDRKLAGLLGDDVIRRKFYAWLDRRLNVYRLSLLPPDAPVRPSIQFETKAEIMTYAEKKRADLMWYPPLPKGAM